MGILQADMRCMDWARGFAWEKSKRCASVKSAVHKNMRWKKSGLSQNTAWKGMPMEGIGIDR